MLKKVKALFKPFPFRPIYYCTKPIKTTPQKRQPA